ncbi:exopolyphosphatase / guanosine-5'-triphosphate,3'-diphosphate pyrophosphatase [Altererythrobacter xiamenensis]|uniref:Exopolyphosphatase / guanosine-5'-triphosphate,3'-diphosphate pyrophosphatase n=1 Tax=Altererythrobacter xiamenensis TaxID=1316679 RepID=A0A1Y6F4Q1_9SPHN|nr:Ppx/GppA family phosphatase [Altererythrobacter xiamenensis]SMQ69864.1 exopolyphosphatase / guanosine-5'-triphosphate,3'-diphosphate pyrophosphatase [Altererythrobacter xiamenensis]
MASRSRSFDRAGSFSGHKAERAIIDIGSNTVRMVVYGGAMRAPTILLNEKVAARLGREITETGRLADDSVELAMRGLRRFVLLLEDLGVSEVHTVATAASREATNGPEFIAAVEDLGLAPRVISGEEEARLSAHAVLGAFPGAEGVVADLGGGSLELVEIANEDTGPPVSLPLGTLRLAEYRAKARSTMRERLEKKIASSGWGGARGKPLYLVGGTWRAMAVYSMEARKFPLTDPHGLSLDAEAVGKIARRLAQSRPDDLQAIERISTMRSQTMPDAAVLLQALLKQLEPSRVVFSSWGLREGLIYDGLAPHAKSQDPLLAGVSHFAEQRGAPPMLATRIAGWTVNAVPTGAKGSERVRLAATMLALASMQIEPNLRLHQAVDWALHKRWMAISPRGRAMLAATIAGNGNHPELPKAVRKLADEESLEEAIRWGLAIRLARRIGARSRRSLQVSRIGMEDGTLMLDLLESHADLFGVPNEKDMKLLADRLGSDFDLRIVPDEEWHRNGGEEDDPFGLGN